MLDDLVFFLEVGWVRPKCGCLLFLLAYYAFHGWHEFGERRWNDILTGENRRTRRKPYPSATLSTTKPTWIDPGANPGLRSERPADGSVGWIYSGSSTWGIRPNQPVPLSLGMLADQRARRQIWMLEKNTDHSRSSNSYYWTTLLVYCKTWWNHWYPD
jgi:hypothetical protein